MLTTYEALYIHLVINGYMPTRETWAQILTLIQEGEGSGGLTPEQEEFLNTWSAILTNTGDGNSYLANDGTYKIIPTFDNFEIVANAAARPNPGDSNVLYLTADDGTLYWWDGTNYQVVDQGLFNNYVDLNSVQLVNGAKTFSGATTFSSRVTFSGSGNNLFMLGSNGIYFGGNTTSFPRMYYDTTTLHIENPETNIDIDTPLGILNYNGSEVLTKSSGLFYTEDSSSIPVIALKPGTKITSASLADATVHEILGVNTYTSPKTYDQTEIGSPEALFNVNIVYDDELTKGHATADIYDENGGYLGKEVFVYSSDITPKFANALDTNTTVSIPQQSIVQYVNYNRQFLFLSDYTVDYTSGTVTITNPDIIGNMQVGDKIEVMYY